MKNLNVSAPTSLQFGPDGRLYVSQQDGTILAITVSKNGPGDYTASSVETITLIQAIPNHNDDGSLAPAEWQGVRQVTGIYVAPNPSDPSLPVLYVGSSDPRIGAGSGGSDANLDTNSGILTKLTYDGTSWTAVDLIRGLPRSEENHATNGLQFDAATNTLYIAQGGHTNAGAPSANFALTTEYAYAAAILSADLAAIEALPTQTDADGRAYKYLLPTLNDPTRADVSSTDGFTDANDPFGGNDGLNQAKIDPNSPVQIYSPGWRNAYDLVLTEGGTLWAIDNGPNPGWGGHPLGESDFPDGSDPDGTPAGVCTNDYDPNEPGSTDIGPGGDPKVNNVDGLHVVTQGYYAGHPTPVRGNVGAGLYLNGTWLQPGDPGLPTDWNTLVPTANPAECDYRSPGETDGALATWFKKSVNGIAEYTTQSALQGDLLLTDLNGGTIQRVDVDASGTGVVSTSTLASGLSAPLDVTQTDESSLYPGNVWIATYGGGGEIVILEPDATLVCDGTDDATIDEDGDGYTNADEIDNGTNLCSASDIPANNDVADEQSEIAAGTRTFLLSDLNDLDDDNDGVSDLSDPFQTDVSNGTTETLPLFKDLFLGSIDQSFAGGVGFTGLMMNEADDYLTMFDAGNLLTGGATGQFSVIEVSSGTAEGTANSQKSGFQLGFQPIATPYVARVQMVGAYFNNNPQDGFEQGFYLGTGDQDNYLKVVLSASADFGALGADGGIEVVLEEGGTFTRTLHPVNGLIGTAMNIDLYLTVDPVNGTVQPSYGIAGDPATLLGSPVPIGGPLLAALQGTHTIGSGVASGPAIGVVTTTTGASTSFQADYEFISVQDATALTSPFPIARLNGGGSSHTGADGTQWAGDANFTGGKTYVTSQAISGTDDDVRYQSERYGNFTYEIPVSASGNYTVRLHFAELWWGVGGGQGVAGERVFNVYVEGTKVLNQFDIIAEAGAPLTAVIREFSSLSVSDGAVSIDFETVVDNAKISAVEVLSESAETVTYHMVTTGVQGSGSVAKTPDQSNYAAGSTINLTATPASGWEFVEWTGDVTGTANPVSVTVNSNLSVTAVFQETVVQYAINASTVGNGSIVKTPDQQLYDAGTTVELTATPDAGWYFAGWSGEVTGTQNPISVTINADYLITATFEELPTADAFMAALTVEDASGRSVIRRFGADGLATDGFDPGIDVEAPPAPPTDAFDARLESASGAPLFTDIRASVTHPSSITWTLAVQGINTPIAVSWDPSLFPPGTLTLSSSEDGTPLDMKTQDEYVVAAGPATLTITFVPYDPTTLASAARAVNAGWALWGLSYDVGALPYTTVLPLAQEGSLIGYEGAYEPRDRMHLGAGYWVNFTGSGTETIDGFPVSTVTIVLDAGWNLVTGPACTVPLPAAITAAYVYENGSYVATTSSTPFEAFWAYVTEPTMITLDCATSQTLATAKTSRSSATAELPARMTLTLTDANGARQTLYVTSPSNEADAARYFLPPRPPQSLFDARFASDSRVSWEQTPSIALQSGAYPITVSVTGTVASGTLTEQSTTGKGRTHLLRNGASFSVTDRSVSSLSLNLPESVLKDLPKVFALKGNYPNPFVSTTSIVVDLPEEAIIDVEVFNILGQRVMRIDDQETPSGTGQTLQLQTSLASGVYLYRVRARMQSETVTKTGKMVIVR